MVEPVFNKTADLMFAVLLIPGLSIFFFLTGFYFTNISDSQDSRGRGRLSL